MLQKAYANPIIKKEFFIFGKLLFPLSLYHFYILQLFDSPYTSKGELTFGDASLFVWICSQKKDTLEKNVNKLENNPDYLMKLKKEFIQWGARFTPDKIKTESEKIAAYLNWYCVAPDKWENVSEEMEPCATPWVFRVFNEISLATNYPPSEIWEMPLGFALLIYSAIAEKNGAKFISEEEQYYIENFDKLTADMEQKLKDNQLEEPKG